MIREVGAHKPKIHAGAFVHESAEVMGRVTLAKDASVWPFCVLRGDVDEIVVGEATNIQDNTVIHTLEGKPAKLGRWISVGHSVVLHGCIIRDHCIIGMGAIVLDGAEIEEDCIIAAGSVVPPGMHVPRGSMVMGVPGKVVRPLKPQEIEHILWNAKEYFKLTELHRKTSRVVS